MGGVGGGGDPSFIDIGSNVGGGDGVEEGGDGELEDTLEGGEGDSRVLAPASSPRLDCPPPEVTPRFLPEVAL
ncbi:hypothetical protein KQX54_019660 [Cotesia glomerata]|uniref:Uncharacterized protein n=1 Tax=Cotesia glomerata TaxID=32391 RepID=A0AAV7HLN4_COTGL|nr:hypothetical protein KQX54_019660 [Cotesia glomerata]